jgi:outer membrane protein assembly factor BamB
MPRFLIAIALLLSTQLCHAGAPKASDVAAPGDWPWWRGPTRNGVAEPGQNPPLKWSDTENILWKAPIPGRGHGSPIVVGNRVIVNTADSERGVQSVLCFDRKTGEQLWETVVHTGGLTKAGNNKSSLASSTPACDGERIYVNFLNKDAIHATALDLNGKKIWQQKVTDYVLHQGFGSSPAIYKNLVLVAADNKGKGLLAGLDRATGDVVWKRERPKMPNYASPIVLNVAGKDQLFFTGCDLVTSLDPATGSQIWEIPGSTTECVTSPVTDGQRVITSGGYPRNHVAAVKADGSGKIEWDSKTRVYVPSMLINDGYLYGVRDDGMAFCWTVDTGKELWKGRIDGTFSASPVLVGDKIFATNEAGRTYLLRAHPAKFELIAENQLGDDALATQAICGNRIYARVAHQKNGRRQEALYCIGDGK